MSISKSSSVRHTFVSHALNCQLISNVIKQSANLPRAPVPRSTMSTSIGPMLTDMTQADYDLEKGISSHLNMEMELYTPTKDHMRE